MKRIVGPLARFLVCLSAISLACEPEQSDPCRYALCDIHKSSCVKHIAEAVACHREEEVFVPTTIFRPAYELTEEWLASSEDLSEHDRMMNEAMHVGASLLGFYPFGYGEDDEIVDTLATIPAFYDGETKQIVIVDHGRYPKPEDDYITLVHEMAHAYQDRREDLLKLKDKHGGTVDRRLGITAMIEGEATLYEMYADAELHGIYPYDMDERLIFTEWHDGLLQTMRSSDVPELTITRGLKYAYGTAFVYDAWRADGVAGVDALFETPPDSSRALMFGYQYWMEAERPLNGDSSLDPHGAPIMPDRFELVSIAHMGVWYIMAMLQKTADIAEIWLPVLNEITSDVLTIFIEAETEEVAVVWRITGTQELRNLADEMLGRPDCLWRNARDLIGDPGPYALDWTGDDLVLIATTGEDANSLFDSRTDWQSIEDLLAGLQDDGMVKDIPDGQKDRPLRHSISWTTSRVGSSSAGRSDSGVVSSH